MTSEELLPRDTFGNYPQFLGFVGESYDLLAHFRDFEYPKLLDHLGFVENDLDQLGGSDIDALRYSLICLSAQRMVMQDPEKISDSREFLYMDVEYLSKLKPVYLAYTPSLALC